MRYCVSVDCRKISRDVDEIKVPFTYFDKVLDIIEAHPKQTIILDLDVFDDPVDWEKVKEYNIMAKNNFFVCLYNQAHIQSCKDIGVKFYLGYIVTNWYDLNTYASYGVSYVRLGSPLIHMLDKVVATHPFIKIRATPNKAMHGMIAKPDGVCGDWIRPEDTEYYSQYVYVYEFGDCKKNPKKEEIIYQIYKDGYWPGDLKDLVQDLNYDGLNRMIPPDILIRRATCRQTCQEPNGTCRICYNILDLCDKKKLAEYAEEFDLRS